MKNATTKITVGIPTYLAGNHLIPVLQSVYNQTHFNCVDKVILAVDGSDISSDVLNKIVNPKLKVIKFEKREGQSARINDLLKDTNSDLIVLLNDDVLLSNGTLREIIKKYKESTADLICIRVDPLQAKSLFESILQVGSEIKEEIISTFKNDVLYLACNGRTICLSKNLYKNIHVPKKLWNSDAFIFLYAKNNKYRIAYINKKLSFFREPNNIKEYLHQTLKFQASFNENSTYFKKDLIRKYYQIPKFILIKSFLNVFCNYPVNSLLYLAIVIFTRIYNFLSRSNNFRIKSYWDTDKSTKKI